MIQVQEHHGVLHKPKAKLLIFNNILAKTMDILNYLCYVTTLFTDIHTTVIRLISGIFSLKEGGEPYHSFPFRATVYLTRHKIEHSSPVLAGLVI